MSAQQKNNLQDHAAVTWTWTGVAAATAQSTNHYTITAMNVHCPQF